MRLAALGLALALVACGGKKAGAPCKGTAATCDASKQTALVCRDGTYVAVACAGPKACAPYKDRVSCDTTVAELGDPCMGDEDEYACSADKKLGLVCNPKTSKFEKHRDCRGPAGCTMNGHTLSCDQSIAEKGDACKVPDAIACSEDKKSLVICRDGHFAVHRFCRGRHGCFDRGDGPSCDLTLSQPGDPCGIQGQVVCSVDGKSELVCQGSTFLKSLSCKTACTVTDRPGRNIDCR